MALAFLGGFFIWRNRFAIQRQLEALGIRTPLIRGSIRDVVGSVASKAAGRFEHGTAVADRVLNREAGTY